VLHLRGSIEMCYPNSGGPKRMRCEGCGKKLSRKAESSMCTNCQEIDNLAMSKDLFFFAELGDSEDSEDL